MALRVLAAAVSMLLLSVLVPAAAVGPASGDCVEVLSPEPRIDRVSGADRYATAACASFAVYPDTADGTVVLARGDDTGGLADALAGTVLAHALDAPVLFTDPEVLPAPTRAELARLDPGRVVVLGGSSSVGDRVMAEVAQLLPIADVGRVGGRDRYATAAAVSAALADPAGSRSS